MFDTADALLLPDAGACSTCPKLSGNAPEFADLVEARESRWGSPRKGSPNLCTDPDCWAAKTKAHLANKAAALQAKGKTVISGAKARQAISAQGQVKEEYVPVAKVRDALKAVKGAAKPEVITIVNPRDGKTVDVVKREDLAAAGVKVAVPKPAGHDNQAWHRQQERERQKLEQANATRCDVMRRVHAAAAAAPRSDFDLRLATAAMLDRVSQGNLIFLHELWQVPEGETLEERVATLPPDQLALLLLDCALIPGLVLSWAGSDLKTLPAQLTAAAEHYGVSVDANTPPKAAPARKKGGKAKAAEAQEQGELAMEPGA
jgi:hypothetical protein